jgi:hypothetical protein
MRKGIVPLDWSLIGSMLANEGDNEQAEFLKALLNEMRTWGTNFQIEMQLCHIASKLSSADRELLSIFCVEHGDDGKD